MKQVKNIRNLAPLISDYVSAGFPYQHLAETWAKRAKQNLHKIFPDLFGAYYSEIKVRDEAG